MRRLLAAALAFATIFVFVLPVTAEPAAPTKADFAAACQAAWSPADRTPAEQDALAARLLHAYLIALTEGDAAAEEAALRAAGLFLRVDGQYPPALAESGDEYLLSYVALAYDAQNCVWRMAVGGRDHRAADDNYGELRTGQPWWKRIFATSFTPERLGVIGIVARTTAGEVPAVRAAMRTVGIGETLVQVDETVGEAKLACTAAAYRPRLVRDHILADWQNTARDVSLTVTYDAAFADWSGVCRAVLLQMPEDADPAAVLAEQLGRDIIDQTLVQIHAPDTRIWFSSGDTVID